MIEGFEKHKGEFAFLFDTQRAARQSLRTYAEPFARKVLGENVVDSTNGWVHWDLRPVYGVDGELQAIDFIKIIDDDRGAPYRSTVREHFKPPIDPDGPLTDDQRKALFAGFRETFGYDADAGDRYAFTRKILGKPGGHDVSWAADKPGTITYAEASRLLDVLDAVKELV